MTGNEVKERALGLPPRERARLAQELWDSIGPEDQAEGYQLHEWQREALDEALEDLEVNPDAGEPADEAMAKVRDEVSRSA